MVDLIIGEADHQRICDAVAAAEARSNGEIVTILSDQSDAYHDVALHWAVAALLATLAVAAAFPTWLRGWHDLLLGASWGTEPPLGRLLFLLMVLAVLAFTAVLFLLKWRALRVALTPGATKHRRVHRRAITLFKAAAERRTVGRTGILIYLSVAEHRAEIVADEAIVKVSTPETWGEAMAALVAELRQGRPAEGLIAAINMVGDVLAEHFPRSDADVNELPNRLIEL